MKTLDTIAGQLYVVASPNGGTVTSADGLVKETVEAGKQKAIFGTGAPLQLDDDAGKIMSTFKRAALVLRLLGGGVKSELPAGYLRAEFLESISSYNTKAQKIELPAWFNPAEDAVAIETRHSDAFYNGALSLEGNESVIAYGIHYEGSIVYRINGENIYQKKPSDSNSEFVYRIESTPQTQLFFIDGQKVAESSLSYDSTEALSFWLFGTVNGIRVFRGKKKYWNLDVNGKAVARLLPALDVAGVPCMLNTVDKGAHYPATSVNFIAGFTLAQARKLGKHLPEGGGSLTISVPTGYEQDAGVAESLETARAKDWTLTVQTYEAETVVATFGMRRIWVRRVQDEQGAYVDADGVRWSVDWCVDMVTPDGSTPDQHGYELYRSTEAAVAYWELEPWADTEAEELLTTESL